MKYNRNIGKNLQSIETWNEGTYTTRSQSVKIKKNLKLIRYKTYCGPKNPPSCQHKVFAILYWIYPSSAMQSHIPRESQDRLWF